MKQYTSAILLAAGTGTRFGSDRPKQFIFLKGKLIAHYSLEVLLQSPLIDEVVIVCESKYKYFFNDYTSEKIRFAPGGSTRQQSVQQGLMRCSPDAKLICIHDSARPLIGSRELECVLEEGAHCKAAALAVPVKNTIKTVDENHFIKKTLDRSLLWEMQTPQVLACDLLWRGLEFAKEQQIEVTDDISFAELLGHTAKIVPSKYSNIKITTPEDILFAAAILESDYVQV